MKNPVAERWEAERAAMQIKPASWDSAITQHNEREKHSEHVGTLNGDRHIEGHHTRKWARRSGKRKHRRT